MGLNFSNILIRADLQGNSTVITLVEGKRLQGIQDVPNDPVVVFTEILFTEILLELNLIHNYSICSSHLSITLLEPMVGSRIKYAFLFRCSQIDVVRCTTRVALSFSLVSFAHCTILDLSLEKFFCTYVYLCC